ncbi:MAG TPA: metallophosphoesterase [Acidimicrobiales bacterium]|nr:metallophosphoesterase [Acidimicrobiales bacterium]
MGPARVVVVADTHLSPTAPEAAANWATVVAHLAADPTDLVVHAGDVTLDGSSEPGELVEARRHLDELGVPWVAVPGNHDIGDNPGGRSPVTVDPERLDRWQEHLGPDRWSFELGGWTVLGLNAQILGSGLQAEAEQWGWLIDALAATPEDRPLLVVTHKPVAAGDEEELATAPPQRFLPPSGRQALTALLAPRRVPLVVSGHVHQFRTLERDGRTHLWAPTTWAVLPDDAQPPVGLKRCGMVQVCLGDDGAADLGLLAPPAMAQLTLGLDLPDPYQG